ncbi:MAG: dienelactone hydrolase family protein [Bacteroidales bacterium]
MMRLQSVIQSGVVLLYILFYASAFAQPFQVGHTTLTFIDPSRNNRQIPTEIYYPALVAGKNVPVAPGLFSVLSYGHGFVMTVDAYANFSDALVPEGYIFALANTETGFSPSHNDLALDLAFIIQSMAAENTDPGSIFYGAVAGTSAVLGHSMGGGASMLAAANDPSITAVVNHAAANTSPSAIQAATDINVPALIFAGSEDCVTPPSQHQEIMYDSLASDCKTLISITGGGHCYFANYNLLCTIGENSCAPNLTVTREEQQDITISFMIPWLDHMLRGNTAAWEVFLDSLESSTRITYQHQCDPTLAPGDESGQNRLKVFPVPFKDYLTVEGDGSFRSLKIYDLTGREVLDVPVDKNPFISVSTRFIRPGFYQMVMLSDHGVKVIRKVCKY